jgi:hypothetical protein
MTSAWGPVLRNRIGAVSVAELVLVAWLFALVMAAIAGLATQQGRLAALQQDRVRFEDAVRTGAVILGSELRPLTYQDLSVGGDSVRIRALRGAGPVCAVDGTAVHVRYRGTRAPEPDKDSLLLVGAGWEAPAAVVTATQSSACGGSVRFLLHSPPSVAPALALVFETGAYSAFGGAIRYRRGQGGRQPLTEAVLRDMSLYSVPGGVRLRVRPDPDSLRRLPDRPVDVPVTVLNAPVDP